MRNREENIFFNLVKNETSLTEVFCNLLQYKVFKNLFLEVINDKNRDIEASSISYENFQTEFQTEEHGRFDLYLKANEDYIFEIKIENNTKLTKHQPTGYLEYLSKKAYKDMNRNLFFILPKGYNHIDDIYKSWSNLEYSKEKIKYQNIIFWEDILKKVKESGINQLNPMINEWSKIMHYRWFDYKDVKFSKMEKNVLFNTTVPKTIKKLFEIVDSTYSKFDIDMSKDKQTNDFYGYKIKDKHNINIWFGVDFDLWEKYHSPLIVEVTNFSIIQQKKLEEKNIFTSYLDSDEDKILFVGLEKNIFENENNIVENFTNKIREIIEIVKEIEIDNS